MDQARGPASNASRSSPVVWGAPRGRPLTPATNTSAPIRHRLPDSFKELRRSGDISSGVLAAWRHGPNRLPPQPTATGPRDRQAFEHVRMQAGALFAAGRSQAHVARAEHQPLARPLAVQRARGAAQRRPHRDGTASMAAALCYGSLGGGASVPSTTRTTPTTPTRSSRPPASCAPSSVARRRP